MHPTPINWQILIHIAFQSPQAHMHMVRGGNVIETLWETFPFYESVLGYCPMFQSLKYQNLFYVLLYPSGHRRMGTLWLGGAEGLIAQNITQITGPDTGFPEGGISQAPPPPLDIVCVTSFALRKIEKHPHSWTFTSTPPLGHWTLSA